MKKYIFTIRLINNNTNELGPIIYRDNRPKTNRACTREASRVTSTLIIAVTEMDKWTGLRTDFIKYEPWM